ncbi:mycothiol system anti-sigma-R factor [Paenibacillus sp. TRM 82003]|uniref:mycothiol system anti-sigma-R factor n=1 Tax=Kineococcus sp. TRM81007 TaxID=2925831 RepID=UPI001F57E475|nr:mycothiol system anti-sigma-R factor [Kineococcus sp. TRM81007]MCI2239246.1 mycothiol system anti-sigma-R factor [Kineococcus sp. TRM81007]MCI3924928.1 mycothiol system anti-sigma-R factor [Paenibacillus sp. TRM 82003]
MSGQQKREVAGPGQECREVLERAFEYLDGEMADLDCERLRAHLEECASCVEQIAEDEKLKRAIRDGCPCETAPTQLRARILVHITEVSAVAR